MISAREFQKIIHRYALHVGGPRFSLENLVQFLTKFVRRYEDEHPELATLAGAESQETLDRLLAELQEMQVIQRVQTGDGGDTTGEEQTTIVYSAFYTVEVERWYAGMSDNRELRFPTENDLKITIPANAMETVEVATDLMRWIQAERGDPEGPSSPILLLRFPDGIDSLVTTVRILQDQMLVLVMNRIRDYLRTDRNADFMESRLRSVFRTREVSVHEEIQAIQTRIDDALLSVTDPSEFQFHLWTQLSSTIIKEYVKKHDKLPVEHGFCQAAYLLGYYAVFHKGRAQQVHTLEDARKLLHTLVQKPPYVFGIQELYKLTDDHGVPLDKKVSQQEIDGWIEEMLARPSEKEISPLVTINTPQRSGLMVHSAQYVPLLQRQVEAVAPVVKRLLVNRMVSEMLEDLREEWMLDDVAFETTLREQIRSDYPLLFGLATFNTLFLVTDGQKLPSDQKKFALSLIDHDNKTMEPWSVVLGIEREELYQDARLQLPIWMVVPVLRGIARLLRRMFSSEQARAARKTGKKGATGKASSTFSRGTDSRGSGSRGSGSRGSGDTGEAQSTEAKRAKFRAALAEMQKEYISADQTPEQRLRQLRNTWNPLIDPVAQENLVEDVNSLCRDALRKLRSSRTLQAPDHDRIRELAHRIGSNRTFDRIRRRREFEAYLELYMITYLHRSENIGK